MVFAIPYDDIFYILESFQPYIKYGKVLHQIGRKICDSNHNFVAIQGTDYVTNCITFCTLWEGVCIDIFSFSDCVSRLDFVSSKKHLDNAPTSSEDEIQGVSPLLSCRFYTLAHDHGFHDLFSSISARSNSFIH